MAKPELQVADKNVHAARCVKSLGVYFDTQMNTERQVKQYPVTRTIIFVILIVLDSTLREMLARHLHLEKYTDGPSGDRYG